MAATKTRKKKVEYELKAETITISATSRLSVKVKDSYYTVEYNEERRIPDNPEVNLELERKALWDTVNAEVDNQIQDIYDTM